MLSFFIAFQEITVLKFYAAMRSILKVEQNVQVNEGTEIN